MAELTRTVAVDVDSDDGEAPRRGFDWPWFLPAILGALGVALAGWILLAGTATLVWLGSSQATLGQALELATQVFALAHGADVVILGQAVTIVPLGLTFLQIFLAIPVVGFAAKQALAQQVDDDRERLVWKVAGLHAATYTLAVTVVTAAVVGSGATLGAFIGSAAVGVVAGAWGAATALDFDPTSRWPRWLQSMPRAIAVALLVVTAIGAVALALAVYVGRGRMNEITEALQPDWIGVLALVLLHVAYVPNLVFWTVAWLLGAGVTLGDDSLISLLITDVGLLPAIPVLGAVPEPGLAGATNLWWLAGGVVAGAVAGLAVAWARPRARFDETALVGGLSGVLAGLAITVAASLASGGLGSDRLLAIGARTDQLVVSAPVLLGLSGMVAGLVLGLIRRTAPNVDAANEPTEQLAPNPEETS